MTRHHSCRVSPFGHPRIHARLTAPRGITQPPTSFIGSQCQGIHHAPLNTYTQTFLEEIAKTRHHSNPATKSNGALRHLSRCSQPLSTNQTPHPTTKDRATTSPISGFPHSGRRDSGLVVSKPNSVSGNPSPARSLETHNRRNCLSCTQPAPLQPPTPHGSTRTQCPDLFVVLLRKEVIQPHLPVRLPCYDFVPIADPTFDGSLPQGVRPPASGVTDFHDVTGGVYKARERIHRSVADLRLLATPTSRGRVADPDPN